MNANTAMQLQTSPVFWGRLRRAAKAALATFALAIFVTPVQAQLKIDITGVGANQIAFSAAPFQGNQGLPEDIKKIIEADLVRSGFFRSINTSSNVDLNEATLIDPTAWKSIGVDALIVGSVKKLPDGRLDLRFNLHDTAQQKSLGKFSYVIAPSALRLHAHKIADFVYEKMLGEKGVFATRIAYVEKSPGRYRLIIADSDGENPQVALASKEPIISPSWSPDGAQLAYVSFETRKPVVFVHTLATGRRKALANFKGSNSAPAWSANGQQLAVVLTKDGGSQIFTMGADGGGLTRITSTGGINTEPAFSHDGRSIFFTSDRGGGPQVYRMAVNGGGATRVTFEGSYNISPRISPDDKTLTYVTRRDGQFKIAALDLASGTDMLLTSTGRDESPSFSPNGRYILYATKSGGKGTLAVVSKDGRIKYSLSSSGADISEPTWGPFLND
ncbi:Tol-Pal system beta propeller repeat protein TolB [Limnobacter parvus]|uniref:Tol-Pal system protein TolB n=1 Tax=Limnobacter parvus TaxID=2939690 RepID=A0ABT1XHF7_9BURK|nr:Tol-Pal system beta propeller repeat protein TolB [Limnobacter parvus]MCR2746319.1 Tol-Pal system beta propeller repeat protein TolB [Limnobacter parvus]